MSANPQNQVVDIVRNHAGQSDEHGYNYYTYISPTNTYWYVEHRELASLIFEYCTHTFRIINDSTIPSIPSSSGLAEKLVGDTFPVIFKFTMSFTDDSKTDSDRDEIMSNLYGMHFIVHMVDSAQGILDENLAITSAQQLWCCVLLSPKPYRTRSRAANTLNIQLILHFPHCRVARTEQQRMLYPALERRLHKTNAAAKLNMQPNGDWKSMLDHDILNHPLPMYGSTTARDIPAPRLEHIFDDMSQRSETKDEKSIAEEIPIQDAFDPANHQLVARGIIGADMFQGEDFKTWIPLFLSADFGSQITFINDGQGVQEVKRASVISAADGGSTTRSQSGMVGSAMDDKALGNINELVDKFLNMINAARRTACTCNWLDIGRALYTTFNGSDIGRKKWEDFTRRGNHVSRKVEQCADAYDDFVTENYITIKTLAWFAREDNRDEFNVWIDAWFKEALHTAASNCADNDIAIACFRAFWLEYLYGPIKGSRKDSRGWWHFSGTTWMSGESAFEKLELSILDSFRDKLDHAQTAYSGQRDRAKSSMEKGTYETFVKNIDILRKTLGKESTVRRVASLMRLRFSTYLPLITIFDSNKHTMGHKNCVWETIDKKYILPGEKPLVVRSYKPEDYISMSTNIYYSAKRTWDDPRVKECMEYMGRVFTDAEKMHFAITVDASTIHAGNRDKIIVLREGGGNNSKSKHQRLLTLTFGNYVKEVSTAVLMSKADKSGAANPEEARLHNARLVIACEPESSERIMTSKVKELTGNDRRYTRTLYDEGDGHDQLFKVTLFTNHPLRVTEADDAIKIRILVLKYMSRWSSAAPQNSQEQFDQKHFPADPDFDDRLPGMAPAYAWILAQYYCDRYRTYEHLLVPACVKKETNEYWQKNDIYNIFMSQRLVKASKPDGSLDEAVRVHYDEAWREFCKWYRDCRFPDLQPDMQRFINNMQTRIGEIRGSYWLGYRINRSETAVAAPVIRATGHGVSVPKSNDNKLDVAASQPQGQPQGKNARSDTEVYHAADIRSKDSELPKNQQAPMLGMPVSMIGVLHS